MSERTYQDLGEDPSLLLVDDDDPFLKRLAKAMEKRGFEVETAGSVAAGRAIATARSPAYAVVDLRLEDGSGLDVVEVLRGCKVGHFFFVHVTCDGIFCSVVDTNLFTISLPFSQVSLSTPPV